MEIVRGFVMGLQEGIPMKLGENVRYKIIQ